MTMTGLTIGVPVYNGADLIGEALDNLCQQSYEKLRILVSDNASTDHTAEIVMEKARADCRIELIRQDTNIGPVGNFRFLAEASNTPFFAWRAHDDLSDSNFFEILCNELQAVPEAALCAPCTLTRRAKSDRRRPFPDLAEGKRVLNWQDVCSVEAGWFYGVFRREAAKTAVKVAHERYANVWGWDYVVLLSALLNGGVTGTNSVDFIHRLTAKGGDQYDFSKKQLRRIFGEFTHLGQQMAAEGGVSGLNHLIFRLNLARLAGRRVTRWQRLI